jgi:hypothetical protein
MFFMYPLLYRFETTVAVYPELAEGHSSTATILLSRIGNAQVSDTTGVEKNYKGLLNKKFYVQKLSKSRLSLSSQSQRLHNHKCAWVECGSGLLYTYNALCKK